MPDVELRADYDHDGRLTRSQAEYDARAAAPGALVVANLDADRQRLPPVVTAGRPVTLDYQRPTKSGADDELVSLEVRVNNTAALTAGQLLLRVTGALAERTVIYDDRGIQLPAGSAGEHLLPPLGGRPLTLSLELRSCPGAPMNRPMTLETVFTPDNTDEINFELQLLGRDPSGVETRFDVGAFSAAPVLFLDNGVTATRLYICDTPDTQAALADVRTALPGLGAVRLVTVPAAVAAGDTWLQDQFQPALCVGADGWRHLLIHCPRMRSNFVSRQSQTNLAAFVVSHFPSQNVGLLNDFWTRELVFTDAAGARVTLPFPDCIQLAKLMSRVDDLVSAINHEIQLLDPSADLHRGTWSELRARLPEIVEDFARRAETAKRDGADSWNATVDALLADARARAAQIRTAMPSGSAAGSVRLTVGTRSFEVADATADKLSLRVHQLEGSANYGGNLESAPPTPDAPLGWIVVGNAIIDEGDADNEADHVDPDLLRFLYKQKQRVFQVDSTWLDVGHVDEMLTFVPDANGSVSFAALRASSGLAMAIIRAAAARYRDGLPTDDPQTGDFRPSGVLERLTAKGRSPVSRMMRGKLWVQSNPRPEPGEEVPDVLDPPRTYQRLSQVMNGGDPRDPTSGRINIYDIHYWPGPGPERMYHADMTVLELLYCERDKDGASTNDFIESRFLAPVDKEVHERFGDARIFPLPVLFDRIGSVAAWTDYAWAFTTSAFTPDVVNLQVVNGHLLVPRPGGPRMKPADALAVLGAVLDQFPQAKPLKSQLTATFLQQRRLTTTTCWLRRHEPVYREISRIGTIRSVFDGLMTLDDVVKAFQDGFPGMAPRDVAAHIREWNPREFTPDGRLRDGWRKIVLHEQTVDLFEAYILMVANALGLAVDWVDTWFFHTHFGGIHCGTNLLREPARGRVPRWWV